MLAKVQLASLALDEGSSALINKKVEKPHARDILDDDLIIYGQVGITNPLDRILGQKSAELAV